MRQQLHYSSLPHSTAMQPQPWRGCGVAQEGLTGVAAWPCSSSAASGAVPRCGSTAPACRPQHAGAAAPRRGGPRGGGRGAGALRGGATTRWPQARRPDEILGSYWRGKQGRQGESDGEEKRSMDEQQEVDWKSDEEFKKFMGNPSIEAAIKLEKKRANRKLHEPDANPVAGLVWGLAKDQLAREKQRLELAEQTFKALDVNKLKICFGYNTFFAVDVRRFGNGGIFIENLRKPVEEARPMLEKISVAAGTDVILWFME